jgi:hypothetical protein
MNRTTQLVKSADELVAATNDGAILQIIIESDLADLPSVRLMPGQTLRSFSEKRRRLTFREDSEGLQLSSDNAVIALDLSVSPERRAIWNDYEVSDLGTISLRALQTVGRVQIAAKDRVRRGRVEVDNLDIFPRTRAASSSGRTGMASTPFKGRSHSGTGARHRSARFLGHRASEGSLIV